VVKGIYQYSRNPMYIGVMLALIGELIFSRSISLLMYAGFVFIMFNLFIFFVEEPRLRRDFGEIYLAYCKRVKRWI
jgi:protein-S-isoprenylcysteine O-methyltransferase Ste14